MFVGTRKQEPWKELSFEIRHFRHQAIASFVVFSSFVICSKRFQVTYELISQSFEIQLSPFLHQNVRLEKPSSFVPLWKSPGLVSQQTRARHWKETNPESCWVTRVRRAPSFRFVLSFKSLQLCQKTELIPRACLQASELVIRLEQARKAPPKKPRGLFTFLGHLEFRWALFNPFSKKSFQLCR
jgi:hypothetical protein